MMKASRPASTCSATRLRFRPRARRIQVADHDSKSVARWAQNMIARPRRPDETQIRLEEICACRDSYVPAQP